MNVFLDMDVQACQDWIQEFCSNHSVTYDISQGKIGFISNLQISQVFHNIQEKADIVNRYADKLTWVFIVETELNDAIADLISLVNRNNVFWLLPGFVKNNSNIIHYGWHIEQTLRTYQLHPLDCSPYTTKPKLFDALLGTNKPHRTFVYDQLHNLGLDDQTVLTYHGRFNNTGLVNNQHWIWDQYSRPFENEVIIGADGSKFTKSGIDHSTGNVEYFGRSVRLSQIIPESVYLESAYSIVTETFTSPRFNFFTEKIAKPILGRRLFVVFSGPGYLADLRRLGFRTFNTIIDESYDSCENETERYQQIIQQLKYLSQLDQQQVFSQIQDICEHNYNLIASGQIHNNMIDKIQGYFNE